jgi:hypothetical protein
MPAAVERADQPGGARLEGDGGDRGLLRLQCPERFANA